MSRLTRSCSTIITAGALSLLAAGTALPAPAPSEVIETYADIAQAGYADSLKAAQTMQSKIDDFLADPTETKLQAAKDAWLAARVPYMQTEVYRFGNKIVDDWEGKVNAWPLDEGLIDYVEGPYADVASENAFYNVNVIANPTLQVSGREIDATNITKTLLSETLHEADNVEANVATGYHAIEFLLWGQDLNGTGPGAGNRPASDFDTENCTHGNCERRAEYLRVVTDLLVDDLEWMTAQWDADGAARKALTQGSESDALVSIFTGLGSLAYGEMAGERMKLGLLLHDPEEEHDCFADNTHNSHYYDVIGIRNVYLGRYERIDGSVVSGPGVSDLVKAKAPDIDQRVREALDEVVAKMKAIVDRAETVEAYDQMIAAGNDEGNRVVEEAITALIALSREFERAIVALDLKAVQFEGSDSLDNPSAVFQ